MHPVCEAPGCDEESRGRVSIFVEGFDGGLYSNLCLAHTAGLMNLWPMILNGLVGRGADGKPL